MINSPTSTRASVQPLSLVSIHSKYKHYQLCTMQQSELNKRYLCLSNKGYLK